MKVNTSLLLAGVLSASLVCAENLTQRNVEQAQAIIEAAVEAHGGLDKLDSINSVVIEPDKMLSVHSPRVGTMKDLQAALEKELLTVGSK